MLKWFEKIDKGQDIAVFSRIRLARNWSQYAFPNKLSDKDGLEIIQKLEYGLKDLNQVDGHNYEYALLEELKEIDRLALKERRILNLASATKKSPTGIIISEDEAVSIILNGDDHIRLQTLESGLALRDAWKRADQMDDFINEHFEYAFDAKYGYLTAFPTNVGTGLKACVVVHLPALSLGKRFNNMLGEMSRFGTTVRGVYGEGSENYGCLYEISNQKSLGQSEMELIDLVERVAIQLAGQEHKVREMTLGKHRLEREDEVYKSYGVLKYARRLAIKESMTYLSQLMAGVSDGIINTKEPFSVYRMMLGIQPSNLQKVSNRPLEKEELEIARASYIRAELPELI